MAAMAALRHFKKEEVEVRGDEVTVVCARGRWPSDRAKGLTVSLDVLSVA
jgi:hypothetical protein